MARSLNTEFEKIYQQSPSYIIQSPGRVNLIGEHTDYNEGFVLPMAIDLTLSLAIKPRTDDHVNLFSLDFNEQKSFPLNPLQHHPKDRWIRYAKAVAFILQQTYSLKGFDAVLTSTIPRGAGLSSSAAFELAIAYAFSGSSDIPWHPTAMARATQRAENQWVGVKCGIMDQMVIANGKKDHAILIDCRDLSTTAIPLPDSISIVIMDTATRRGLVESAYNERRTICESASQLLGIKALRDITLDDWSSIKSKLPFEYHAKVRHVVSENDRVLKAVEAMKTNNVPQLGQLFNESHQSLRDDYEVCNDALNTMVDLAQQHPACFGARMTGAGFGGCAVALVDATKTEAFKQTVTEQYQQKTNLSPTLYDTKANEGVRSTLINLSSE